ncbi:MAG: hypothetical protein ACR2PG_25825 [Hyphomicrobiaceae bacterium]
MPDARYELKSFALDEKRNNVAAYGVFHGARIGQGGPCPPTGWATASEYVDFMDFKGDKI